MLNHLKTVHPPRLPAQKAGGFTLVEVMVVLTLIGILTMVALPSFTGVIRSLKASSEANSVLSVVRYMRTESAKRGAPVSLVPRAGETTLNKGWRIYLDPANSQNPGDPNVVLLAERNDVSDGMLISIVTGQPCITTPNVYADTAAFSLGRTGQCGNNAIGALSIVVGAKDPVSGTMDMDTRRVVCMSSAGRLEVRKPAAALVAGLCN